MLKNVAYIIVSLFLLTAVTGVSVSRHYCGDHLMSVSLFDNNTPCCDVPIKGCCHDENETFQLKTEFAAPSATHLMAGQHTITSIFLFGIELLFDSANTSPSTLYADRSSPPQNLRTFLASIQSFLL